MTYNKYEHTIVCTTSGGPATSVVWYKDNSQLDLNNIPFYKFSQIVVDTHTATYENRLTILNKSFMASGEYTCRVVNAKGSASHVLNVSGDCSTNFKNIMYYDVFQLNYHIILYIICDS